MTMNNLCSEMHIALHYATVEVYNNFIKRCIIECCYNEERYKLLKSILEEVVIPEEAFKWLSEYDIEPPLQIIELLMNKKMELDEFIHSVLAVCHKEGYEYVSVKRLNDIMLILHPSIKISFKIYLFQLLLDDKYYSYIIHILTTPLFH